MPGDALLISVVIPARDRASLIGFQLEALAGQSTERSFEVIVADNGSSDDTVAVAESFADRFDRLEVVDASAVVGAGPARNVGAAVARGEMIAFCDSDDIVHPDWLEALAAAWTPGTLVAGRLVRRANLSDPGATAVDDERELPRRPSSPIPTLAGGGNMAMGRVDFERLGGFDPSFQFGQDLELSWRAQLDGLIFVSAPDAVVFYRRELTGAKLFRQNYRWGRVRPQMYRMYGAAGYPRRRPGEVGRGYARLAYHAARAPFDETHRSQAIRQAATYIGCVAGSVRYRVLYP